MLELQKRVAMAAVVTFGFLLSGCSSTYQLVQGDLAPLAGQTQLNLEYDYEGMSVGKHTNEDQYVREGIAERDEDEPGSGAIWAKEWVANRANIFQPRFEELLNSRLDDVEVRAGSGLTSAKYTAVIKTTHTETGWNVALMRVPAHINLQVRIVETGNPSQAIAVLEAEKVPGADAWGFDFAVSSRLKESYAKAGKELGILLAEVF